MALCRPKRHVLFSLWALGTSEGVHKAFGSTNKSQSQCVPEAKVNSGNEFGQERRRETEETTTMTSINQSTNLLAWLLAAIAFTPTNAKPIISRDQAWNEQEAEPFKHLALGGSKFLQELANNPDHVSHTSRSDDESKKTNEKAAIIGGTVACGIILGITIFLGVLICKRCIASRRVESKQHQAKWPQRNSVPETTTDSTYRDTWRDTFNHRVPTPGTPDSESIGSDRSFGAMSTDGQVMGFAPGKWPKPVVNYSKTLGINQENRIDPSIASGCPQIETPLLPKPLRLPTTYEGPFATDTPSYTIEMTLGPTHRESGASACTMSTLGRDLLQDTMQPPAPVKYSLFPKCEPLPETTHAVTTRPVKPKQAPPAAMDNPKKPGRMSSRRYFVPLFGNNGQLQSPTSPKEKSVGIGTVTRDESRANMFSLGENKI
ncbi:hypothetical protein BHE90_014321 [Fusarium euwallaceae]|uniref:Uncharacterized protein n=1 Tax=Fusarium euwallaceae TaxID=1147111 RepID=A0A430L6I8_9HYPO|nr:hypothetical protein BHE90_014321 [Fusarium euwallaceae]